MIPFLKTKAGYDYTPCHTNNSRRIVFQVGLGENQDPVPKYQGKRGWRYGYKVGE
jgi:hypothetical protein